MNNTSPYLLSEILPSTFDLLEIPQEMGNAGLAYIGQKSVANWLLATGIDQENAYQVEDLFTIEIRRYDRIIASFGNGRYVMVRADELKTWLEFKGPCPSFDVSGDVAGRLQFVLRQWVEVSSEQNRFRTLLEKTPSWQLFLQRASQFDVPRNQNPWVSLTEDEAEVLLLGYFLTTVGITGTPSVIRYAQERLSGKEPSECQTLPMRGALVTSFLMTYGLSAGMRKHTKSDGTTEEYDSRLAQVH